MGSVAVVGHMKLSRLETISLGLGFASLEIVLFLAGEGYGVVMPKFFPGSLSGFKVTGILA